MLIQLGVFLADPMQVVEVVSRKRLRGDELLRLIPTGTLVDAPPACEPGLIRFDCGQFDRAFGQTFQYRLGQTATEPEAHVVVQDDAGFAQDRVRQGHGIHAEQRVRVERKAQDPQPAQSVGAGGTYLGIVSEAGQDIIDMGNDNLSTANLSTNLSTVRT